MKINYLLKQHNTKKVLKALEDEKTKLEKVTTLLTELDNSLTELSNRNKSC